MEKSQILTWNNVSIFSEKNKRQKYILNSISGSATSGKILAIMGASGSGKTTLLKVLTGQLDNNFKSNGSVNFNNMPRTSNFYKKIAFARQDDECVEYYTVYETLLCSAMSKNRNMKLNEIDEKIRHVMKKLSILKVKNSLVSKISGGELKRMHVAECILSNRDVLMFDEPTSGLDSKLALELVHYLRKIAKNENKVLIITIHQPSNSIMEFIDDILFIKNGKSIYFGKYSEVKDYFKTKNFKLPKNRTITEFLYFIGQKSSVAGKHRIANRMAYERLMENQETIPAVTEISGKSRLRSKHKFGMKMIPKLVRREFLMRLRTGLIPFIFGIMVFFAMYFGFLWISLKTNEVINSKLPMKESKEILYNKKQNLVFGVLLSIISLVSLSYFSGSLAEKKLRIVEIGRGDYTLFESFFAVGVFNVLIMMCLSLLMLYLTRVIYDIPIYDIMCWILLSTLPIFIQTTFISTLIEISIFSNLYLMLSTQMNGSAMSMMYDFIVLKGETLTKAFYYYFHLHPTVAIPILFYASKNPMVKTDTYLENFKQLGFSNPFNHTPMDFLLKNEISHGSFVCYYALFMLVMAASCIPIIMYKFTTYERLNLERKPI